MQLISGMIEELRLRRRIEQLKAYQQRGLESLPPKTIGQENHDTLTERERRLLRRERVESVPDDPTAAEVQNGAVWMILV